MPDVSVVLPVFNGAETIARAVGSILDQSLREIELIVVDDGSTDGTAAVLGRFDDPRLKVVSVSHRGVAAAANVGTAIAAAPLIARMDADDVSHQQRLEKQLVLLREQKLDAVGCRVRILQESGDPSRTMQRYERWINEETIGEEKIAALRFVEFPLVNPTILARREYFEFGFHDGDFPEDYDLMLRAAARGMRFGKVPDVLFDWYDGPQRITRNDRRYSRDAFLNCRRRYLLSGPLRDVQTVDLWGAGSTGKRWLRWLQRQGIGVRRCYEVNRRKIGRRIHGVTIVPPAAMPIADETPLVIAVGAEGARELIRTHIQPRGHVPGQDAWFVA